MVNARLLSKSPRWPLLSIIDRHPSPQRVSCYGYLKFYRPLGPSRQARDQVYNLADVGALKDPCGYDDLARTCHHHQSVAAPLIDQLFSRYRRPLEAYRHPWQQDFDFHWHRSLIPLAVRPAFHSRLPPSFN